MKKRLIKASKKIAIPVIAIIVIALAVSLSLPKKTKSANFSSASVTLGNPRISYVAEVSSGTSGQTLITIAGTSDPDNDTDHLFPKDDICFTQSTPVGCRDNKDYPVASITTSTTFNTSDALTTTLTAGDLAVATQAGTMTISFTLANDVPNDGNIFITIPMANDASGNDGFPDYATGESASGFDMNKVVDSTDITIGTTTSGSCGNGDWGTPSLTVGSGSTDHTIEIARSSTYCEADSTVVTVTIDDTPGIANPAPKTSSHTQGQADVYVLNIKTRDGSDDTIDESDVLAAPVEAVLISATVDETLSFQVCGVETDRSDDGTGCFTTPTTICGLSTLVANSTPMSIPFGTISTADNFLNMAQYLIIGTNADSGYTVKIEQEDQMGKDGVTCTGNPTDPVTTNCIPDNPGNPSGGSSLDFDTADDCDLASTNGLCFTMDNGEETGSPNFEVKYDVLTDDCEASPDFCAKAAADGESSEIPENLFSYGNPVSDHDAFICWRLSIDAIQPAGYYYNKVKYTATPIF